MMSVFFVSLFYTNLVVSNVIFLLLSIQFSLIKATHSCLCLVLNDLAYLNEQEFKGKLHFFF